MDTEIDARLAEANSAYNKLTEKLWLKCVLELVLKSMSIREQYFHLSCMEVVHGLTLTRKLVRKLEKLHLTCLRKMAGIRWYHKVPNY